jgi:hypothetical protein
MDLSIHRVRQKFGALCAERSLELIDLWVHIFTTINKQLS